MERITTISMPGNQENRWTEMYATNSKQILREAFKMKCDYCEFNGNGRRGLNIHMRMVHPRYFYQDENNDLKRKKEYKLTNKTVTRLKLMRDYISDKRGMNTYEYTYDEFFNRLLDEIDRHYLENSRRWVDDL